MLKKTKKTSATLREINHALPDLKSEKVEDIATELDKILAIKKLFQSEGGAILIETLRNNCTKALRLALLAARKGDSAVPFLLDYGANIDLLSTVQDISIEDELRQQLDEAVVEASTR